MAELSNWSKTGRSPCHLFPAADIAGISDALSYARDHNLAVIPRGAGHSYTDAAWNTGGMVVDLTPMRRIISWDPDHGVIRVEAGVTLSDILQVTWKDGWWPFATPSTPAVTIGGCIGMNVVGKNSVNCGTFGDHILALEVLLAGGNVLSLTPERDGKLFHAFVGSLGLLGIVISATLQLQRLPSDRVRVETRGAATLAEMFALFAQQQPQSDFIEGWIDGFAVAHELGRGQVTSATMSQLATKTQFQYPPSGASDHIPAYLVNGIGALCRPLLVRSLPMANRARYYRSRWLRTTRQTRSLPAYTYYPPTAFTGYHVVFPRGVETFHAFVPGARAQETFESVLRYSQDHGSLPIWCIMKQHRRDAFLLSYQVDGFSLELNYPRNTRRPEALERVLRHMIEIVISAGGRFYLAKDHFQTREQYRRSVGDTVVDHFLELKERFDPESLWQSDLYHRLFAEPPR
ncbi:MAG: FAD-binding oxidoreductase [Ktedonobacterales bacterium]